MDSILELMAKHASKYQLPVIILIQFLKNAFSAIPDTLLMKRESVLNQKLETSTLGVTSLKTRSV